MNGSTTSNRHKGKAILARIAPGLGLLAAYQRDWLRHDLIAGVSVAARSGEPAMITGYLGQSDTFDKAIADFSVAYADQSEQDHEAVTKAVQAGKGEVLIERE